MANLSNLRYLRPTEIAQHLGFSVKSIQRFCRAGILPAKKFGKRRWLIQASDLERILEAKNK